MARNTEKTLNQAKLVEKLPGKEIIRLKEEILKLLDSGAVKTVSAAARKAGVSPTKAWGWLQTDDSFRDQARQAQKVLADGLIEELLQLDKDAKMPWVTARIFLIKGMQPEFRDNYRIVEFKDQRALALLEELRRLGKEKPEPKPENPLKETIERVENGEPSSD